MKGRIRYLVTITLLCVVGVMLFYHFTNEDEGKEDESGNRDNTVVTEVDKLLSKDLEKNYPATVREVINLFTRIQQCYYNEKCSSEELVRLSYMATALFDEELKTQNPYDEYFAELQDEVKQYQKEGKTISRVIVDKSSNVMYSDIEGVKYASINCIYYLKTSKTTEKTIETYALRKDEEGRWRILGWKLAEESDE